MSYSAGEVIKVVIKRTGRLFKKKNGHMSLMDRLRLRFLKPGKEVYQYSIFGKPVRFSFGPFWFYHSYKEIFEQEVYKFNTPDPNPLIIDCGSNIGLSIIYFKRLYPNAKVISFEPDDNVFKLLRENLNQFSFSELELVNKAVWTAETNLMFNSRGDLSGSITESGNIKTGQRVIQIPAVRLRDYLDKPVSFLKIDIEGAELPVLEDCKDRLQNVENLFVEYHCYPNEPLELTRLLTILTDAGFRYYIRQASENMLFPFVEKHGKYCDIQLNIFCFRDHNVG